MPEVPPTLAALVAPASGPNLALVLIAFGLAALYLAGAVRLWMQGRRWSIGRTVLFLLGCVVLAATAGLGVEDYGRAMLSVFMFQQLTLMMTVPPLLVFGSPGTLLLRATPHRGLGRWVLRVAHAGLRSRVMAWVLSPWLGLPLFLLSFYGLYLTGLSSVVLATEASHIVLEVAMLGAGVIFAVPVVSADPLPARMGYGARALDLLAEAALHAFFGVFLMMSTTILVPHFTASTVALGIDPFADQNLAGGLAWSYGEAPTLIMMIYVMHRWFRDDSARAAATDRYVDRHGDADLDAYNDYLAKLQQRDRER